VDEGKPDHKYYNQEKQLEQRFDAALSQLQARYKIQTIPWLKVTKTVVWIFLILTMLQMWKRNVFLSITVGALALYVLDYPEVITRQTFRGLVLLIVVSWVYDFLQLFFIDASVSTEDEEDGGNEATLRRFTRLLSYIALIFKVIVVLVFWKDSLDFRNIISQKAASSDDEIEEIINRYADSDSL